MLTNRITVIVRASAVAALIGLSTLGAAATANAVVPFGTPPPVGGDPTFAAHAQSCYRGSMTACDDLYYETNSTDQPNYNRYGDSCGGRLVNEKITSCVARFGVS